MDHLFFTIGNGYVWKAGQLVSKVESEPRLSWQMYIHEALGRNLQLQMQEIYDKCAKLLFTEALLPEPPAYYTHTAQEQPVSFYPISTKFSRVFTVPNDVQSDWLSGAIEFLTFALDSPVSWWSSGYDLSVAEQRKLCTEQLDVLTRMENDESTQ